MTVAAVATVVDDDDAQITFANGRCMSFCFPSHTTTSWWWCRRWKAAARELSEIANWKAFVNRFLRLRNKSNRHCSFRYDPLSYALNFDDGIAAGDDCRGYGGFSARFASVPAKDATESREEHVPTASKIEE
ncbi:hypothetical protein Fmac_016842 [Flemingia macrophylla]|uniref:Uncharacterized protein n=1 Tax=Flemingia macrophylla TaxID=520843 RepID=A0ABD1MIP6_9FABA